MSRNVQRLTDVNAGGGAITSIPQNTVFVNGLPVSINGSLGTSHPPCPVKKIHCQGIWVTMGGSSTVSIANTPVNRMGDVDTCGHPRVGGSPNVFIGG